MRSDLKAVAYRTPAIIFALLSLAVLSLGQTKASETSNAQGPKVVFELEWAQADPHWYQISIDALGSAEYRSQDKLTAEEAPGDPFVQKFVVTSKTRERIFALASAANHFEGNFDYKGSTRMAQTGAKTLRYESGGKTTQTTFNYSENKNIMELVSLYQGIALTVDLGRELAHARRFDKLGIDAILRRLEEMYKSNGAIEIQAIAPVLQQIADDRSSLNMARQRASHLLAAAAQ